MKIPSMRFTYTNYRGETSDRWVVPQQIYFGSNQYHTQEQMIMVAWDINKGAYREFAMRDISAVHGKLKLMTVKLYSADPRCGALGPLGSISNNDFEGYEDPLTTTNLGK